MPNPGHPSPPTEVQSFLFCRLGPGPQVKSSLYELPLDVLSKKPKTQQGGRRIAGAPPPHLKNKILNLPTLLPLIVGPRAWIPLTLLL